MAKFDHLKKRTCAYSVKRLGDFIVYLAKRLEKLQGEEIMIPQTGFCMIWIISRLESSIRKEEITKSS
ncbi:hypothetical protein CCACVL1_03714 [Corchorus capsularis]|uniref:Uncharacterized protein n=1 Tax=Corchorus capsularis TaxID=210143 RepID=A0A1R3JXP4_COCAP|nr:hypothetical protein CCACVL1_03714 [Corchorus capsularis]